MKTRDGRELQLAKDNLTIEEAQEYLREALRLYGKLDKVSPSGMEEMGLQLFRKMQQWMNDVRNPTFHLKSSNGEHVNLEETYYLED